MQSFTHYRLNKTNNGIEIILFLNENMMEFADELGSIQHANKQTIEEEAVRYTKKQFPNLKVKAIKVMAGALLVTTIGFFSPTTKAEASANVQQTISTTYQVVAGDTLSEIAQRFGTTVNAIKLQNNLTTDLIRVGQTLTIPSGNIQNSTYVVVAGDTLSHIAKRNGTTVDAIKNSNNLTTDFLRIGQTLVISTNNNSSTIQQPEQTEGTHRVAAGDSLWKIANTYGTTVEAIKITNQLTSDFLQVGQVLAIPSSSVVRTAPSTEVGNNINQEELEWLARIIYAEARGESLNGQIAVGAVILNRVKSNQFPNNVKEVIFERSHGHYQFSPAGNGALDMAQPNSTNYDAAKRALNGEDPTNGSLYFYNPSKTGDTWVRSRTVSTIIGNHVFAF
ncbi:hypothetical protein BKP45_08250 [Anaerobacillus alkalidiazotrophicus]|uniref:LysM domain-containing protein n=1 Tax=Anaerobacillus alkalidiazotrophicus TaxID=472963 RepID=A0A1S2M8D9_9BACI|nr:LysM peptidoglycan-binding domain-containing protein [Anaerobacillus alkalidiazotrophicus]OIJ20780.1 hypothetical protein BKP45_08250 [Anaerobacillus alkalidiazotrophicus]